MENIKVLLVDDEEEFADILSERLKNRGVTVHQARDGFEAIKMVKKEDYEAVILDFAMPGLDGIETLEVLLSKKPNLQVILLTGQATLEKGVQALKLGAMDVLEKPTDISKIMGKIKEAQTERMLIVSKEAQERIEDILKSKGW
ncbi:MAG: response regulator [Candidatus Kapabacteria bacterium]|jgi:two-component system OmpR family response regulator|nr:response regulator [Candidatus Kapabacteria bacterium]